MHYMLSLLYSKAEREYDILKQEYLDLLVKHPTSKSLENIDAALATCINAIRREKTKFNF